MPRCLQRGQVGGHEQHCIAVRSGPDGILDAARAACPGNVGNYNGLSQFLFDHAAQKAGNLIRSSTGSETDIYGNGLGGIVDGLRRSESAQHKTSREHETADET